MYYICTVYIGTVGRYSYVIQLDFFIFHFLFFYFLFPILPSFLLFFFILLFGKVGKLPVTQSLTHEG